METGNQELNSEQVKTETESHVREHHDEHEEHPHEHAGCHCGHEEHHHEHAGCHCEHEGHHHDHEEHHHHGHECGCGHCHGHCEGMEEEENRPLMIGRLIVSAVLLLAGLFFPAGSVGRLVLSLLSALCIGYDVLLGAGKNLLHGEMLDEMFLMSVATVGAFILGEYTEGAMVFLLF